jgi:hypothetical protein
LIVDLPDLAAGGGELVGQVDRRLRGTSGDHLPRQGQAVGE